MIIEAGMGFLSMWYSDETSNKNFNLRTSIIIFLNKKYRIGATSMIRT